MAFKWWSQNSNIEVCGHEPAAGFMGGPKFPLGFVAVRGRTWRGPNTEAFQDIELTCPMAAVLARQDRTGSEGFLPKLLVNDFSHCGGKMHPLWKWVCPLCWKALKAWDWAIPLACLDQQCLRRDRKASDQDGGGTRPKSSCKVLPTQRNASPLPRTLCPKNEE